MNTWFVTVNGNVLRRRIPLKIALSFMERTSKSYPNSEVKVTNVTPGQKL